MPKNRITSTDYRNPYRPLLLRVANSVWPTASLDMNNLLETATKKEQSDNFGAPDFHQPLEILLASIVHEAELTPFGRFITRQRILHILRNRLRVEAMIHAHPEIEHMTLPPVLLITGLQRTGTTMLHRLLSADTDTRSLASWEAINPAPLPGNPEQDRKKRKKLAAQSQKALAYLSPDFFAIHPVEANAPEEDVLLLDYSFISTVAESIMNVPTYAKWVETTDHRPAYQYMEKLLRILQFQHPGKRWILKSPHHLEFLHTFFEFFPNAKVIQTARNPVATLPSFCSMICHGHGIFSNNVDPLSIGRHWLQKTARMLDKGLQVRSTRPSQFLDVRYADLVNSPETEINRIHEFAGITPSLKTLAAMKQMRHKDVQHRHGVHRYDMSDFGLTPDIIFAAYHNYLHSFDPHFFKDS